MKKTDSFFSCQCTLSLRARQIFFELFNTPANFCKNAGLLRSGVCWSFSEVNPYPAFPLNARGRLPNVMPA